MEHMSLYNMYMCCIIFGIYEYIHIYIHNYVETRIATWYSSLKNDYSKINISFLQQR